MLKNKNNFEIINWFFHCQAEKILEHNRSLKLWMLYVQRKKNPT